MIAKSMRYETTEEGARRRTTDVDDQICALHASVCQALANPTRLKILNALRDQEVTVTELARQVGARLSNLSQHLAILKERGVVLAHRHGVNIHYRIANPKILAAFDIMREVLFERLTETQRLYTAYAERGRRPLRGGRSRRVGKAHRP